MPHSNRPLAVGNPIEDCTGLLCMDDFPGDGVGGYAVVLVVAPDGLHYVQDPSVDYRSGKLMVDGVEGLVADKLGEGLVQPEVLPPLHSDQISEPHVGHLVQDYCPPVEYIVRNIGSERKETF